MIVNLRTILPERRLKGAHDPQMIEFQLNDLNVAGEILLHIDGANVQTHSPGVTSVPILGLNYHFHPPEGSLSMECMQLDVEKDAWGKERANLPESNREIQFGKSKLVTKECPRTM